MTFLKEFVSVGLIVLLSGLLYLQDVIYPLTAAASLIFLAAHLVIGAVLALTFWSIGKNHPHWRLAGYFLLLLLFVDLHSSQLEKNFLYYNLIRAVVFTGAAVWFLRKHLNTLIPVIFGTMAAATLVMMVIAPPETPLVIDGESSRSAHANDSNSVSDNVIHLVLDEHIVIQGIPLDMPEGIEVKERLDRLFSDFGFRVYEGAYTHFFATIDAIPNDFNNNPLEMQNMIRSRGDHGYELHQNLYFQHMRDRGYNFNVVQSDFLDLCNSVTPIAEHCVSYRAGTMPWHYMTDFDLSDRLYFMVASYSGRSALRKYVANHYHNLNEALGAWGVHLPVNNRVWRPSPSTVVSKDMYSQMLATYAPNGNKHFQFGHFIFPHPSFAYDAECNVKPLPWLNRMKDPSTSQARIESFRAYFEQVHCSISMLRGFFESLKEQGLLDSATIIVQGDHGARIHINGKSRAERPPFTTRDYREGYSTLFVIKGPNIPPGTDDRQVSVPELIFHHMVNEDGAPLVPEEPFVHEIDEDWNHMRVSLPPFVPQ